MTANPQDPLLAYLREQGPRYSLEALREHLLTQGYDASQVDAALAVYRQEQASGPPAGPGSPGGEVRRGTLATTFLVLAILAGIGLMLFGTCAGLLGVSAMGTASRDTSYYVLMLICVMVFALGLFLIVFAARRLGRRSRRA